MGTSILSATSAESEYQDKNDEKSTDHHYPGSKASWQVSTQAGSRDHNHTGVTPTDNIITCYYYNHSDALDH